MMDSEIHFPFDRHPAKEELETLTLSDPLSAVRSPPDGSDPLLNPPDPPPYADVVYNGTITTTAAATSSTTSPTSSSTSPTSSSTSPYLRISVSDPQKEEEPAASLVPGASTFVTYLITTETRDHGRFAVRRRFRDVVALADRLAEAYRGYFIPPRPDKSLIESQVMQKQEFVEQRRSALEKYLLRLVAHPAIGRSDELAAFLKGQGRLPLARSGDVATRALDGAAAAGPEEEGQPAKGGRDLMRMFRELRQSVANDWGGGRPPAVDEDREFLERKEKMQDLEQQLSTASQQAEALVKAQQDIGETMGQLGLTFFKLGKFETEEALYNSQRTRATDFKRLATAAIRASRSYRELNAQSVKHLDTLHEYLGLMLAVHSAFSDRSSALLTVQTLMSDLSSLHTRAERLEGAASKIFIVDRSRYRKIEELKETIRATEDAKLCAIREYERIKENNRNELERLDRERCVDFLRMLKGFIINQIGYADKAASVWAQVVEETSRYAKPWCTPLQIVVVPRECQVELVHQPSRHKRVITGKVGVDLELEDVGAISVVGRRQALTSSTHGTDWSRSSLHRDTGDCCPCLRQAMSFFSLIWR